ncbi:deoxyribonuclease II, partial [Kipferlia bialata]|eukprot:g14367.t1
MRLNAFLLVAALLGLCIAERERHISSSTGGLHCLNESGAPVDWWVVLKYNLQSGASDAAIEDGYGYAYLDSVNSRHLMTSEGTLKDTDKGAVSLTMKMIQ